jgi:hypothetical protein
VQNGEDAQLASLQAIELEPESAELARLRENLLAYCRVDTLAMVELARLFGRGGGAAVGNGSPTR